MMTIDRSAQIATRVTLGIAAVVLAGGVAIGLPVALGNAHTASNNTARIVACTHIGKPSVALQCVEKVIDGTEQNYTNAP